MTDKIDAECGIINPIHRERRIEIVRLPVDTNSLYTWISATLLEEAGVMPQKLGVPFQTSGGRILERATGFAIVRVGDRLTIDEVVFARPGDAEVLGSRTLEGLNLVVDPESKQLITAGPLPAAVFA